MSPQPRVAGATYEAVIGLEVHAQLNTRTKIFCGCRTSFGDPANSHTCPVCLGHPGALPVLNREAVRKALIGALALGCRIERSSVFARKHYFYPDLPKGYQISQFDRPLAVGGEVPIETDGGPRSIPLVRVHLEEDAGKLIHDDEARSKVDFNRAGTPLVEIVSEPEIRSPAEARAYLERLRSTLLYVDVCDGSMERGSLRCDANVSIRPRGSDALGERTEVKNLNSFRNVEKALEYELARQGEIIAAGGVVRRETVSWDARTGVTQAMRQKEEAHDYRYVPDPDLPPLVIEERDVAELRRGLPELPAARRARLIHADGLDPAQAGPLTLEPRLADYYEAVVAHGAPAAAAANWILNDLLRALKEEPTPDGDIRESPEHLARMIDLIERGTISVTVARQVVFPEIYRRPRDPERLVAERGLQQQSDEAELKLWVAQAIAVHPDEVAGYRAGKKALLDFLVGKVMEASAGTANPRKVSELLRRQLDDPE